MAANSWDIILTTGGSMFRRLAVVSFVFLFFVSSCGDTPAPPGPSSGTKQSLSIVWAQWAPADVLKQMADEWGKANNVDVKCTFFPWTEYQEKLYAEFKATAPKFDLAVGDSQWIGK